MAEHPEHRRVRDLRIPQRVRAHAHDRTELLERREIDRREIGDDRHDEWLRAGSDDVSVLAGLGRGDVAASAWLMAGAPLTDVACADLDDDGVMDLAVAEGTVLSIHRGVAGATPLLASTVDLGEDVAELALADMNEDGRLDVLVTQPASGSGAVLLSLL